MEEGDMNLNTWFLGARKDKEVTFPQAYRKGSALLTPWFHPSDTPVGLVNKITVR